MLHTLNIDVSNHDEDAARAAATELAFDLLSAVFQSVRAVLLDTLPNEGPGILRMLQAEIGTAARQVEAARPDWAQAGIVARAERRVCALLEAAGGEADSMN